MSSRRARSLPAGERGTSLRVSAGAPFFGHVAHGARRHVQRAGQHAGADLDVQGRAQAGRTRTTFFAPRRRPLPQISASLPSALSTHIRAWALALGRMKEIVDAAKRTGINVTATHLYNVRSQGKKRGPGPTSVSLGTDRIESRSKPQPTSGSGEKRSGSDFESQQGRF
jgi:hypothetical protein